jgi:dipeptidyl aminopeptidase/acylaminoacyl peptidase
VSDGALVAYRDADDLWLYDAAADANRRLTSDGDARLEFAPAFLDVGCLVHASNEPTTINVVDLSPGGPTRGLLQESMLIASLALSPDGATLLYLRISYDTEPAFRLVRVPMSGGRPELLHTFEPSLGRGGSSEDEVSVAWSPDGARILVANTHAFSRAYEMGSIHLFDVDGRELHRWAGTHPRWSPDGARVYFRGHAGLDGDVVEPPAWQALDVATMETIAVGMRAGTNGAAISPDGRFVAYDTSWFGDIPIGTLVTGVPPDVYLYHLQDDRETLLLHGGVGPLWISATELLVTEAGPAGPNTIGSWDSLGTALRLTIAGGRSPAGMTSTAFDAAVLLTR